MAYIGRGIDKLSNIEKLDVITFDGSSSYSLTKGSVAFTPSSVNSLQVSIDGVVQAGNFTVSGSTIDFGTAVASTSTNDFIFHYGTGLITTPADGTVTTGKLADDAVTFAKTDGNFGKIGQVLQTVKTDTFTSTSTSFTDVTGLSVAITPTATSSKVLVFAHIVGCGEVGTNHGIFRIVRDSTAIYAGDSAGSRSSGFHSGIVSDTNSVEAGTGIFLDSPSTTSATTYKIQGITEGSTFFVNRSPNDGDSKGRGRLASSITVIEVLV